MAKDDFHVIVYRILNYLYKSFKSGIFVDSDVLNENALEINEKYFNDTLTELFENGYIKGIEPKDVKNKSFEKYTITKDTSITMKGIEYLTSSDCIYKAKKFYMGTLPKVPFIEEI